MEYDNENKQITATHSTNDNSCKQRSMKEAGIKYIVGYCLDQVQNQVKLFVVIERFCILIVVVIT